MNPDNFIVRPQREWVQRYAEWSRWQALTAETAGEIAEHLAGLPSAVRDDDEQAKRFDLLMLRIQLAQLDGDHLLCERLRQQVQDIAAALLGQTTIPVIAAQQTLLDEVAGDEWWVDVTLPMLELARRRIRGLVRFIEKSKGAIVYTNFEEELGQGSIVALPGVHVGTNWERFKAKARAYLKDREDHVALQRLRRNKQLTAADLSALEEMLLASGVGGPDDLARARDEAHGLGLFIRSLVGLDREAATEAFSEFLTDTRFSAAEIRFIQMIVEHLTPTDTGGNASYVKRTRYASRWPRRSRSSATPLSAGTHSAESKLLVRKTSRPPGRSSLSASGTQRCGSHQAAAPCSLTTRSKCPSARGTRSASACTSGKSGPNLRCRSRAVASCSPERSMATVLAPALTSHAER